MKKILAISAIAAALAGCTQTYVVEPVVVEQRPRVIVERPPVVVVAQPPMVRERSYVIMGDGSVVYTGPQTVIPGVFPAYPPLPPPRPTEFFID